MERVSVIQGSFPAIIVAPHGYEQDDENTGYLTENIAKYIKAYAVINNGWERSNTYDYAQDRADCNNVYHCKEDVVREEFLEPIIRFKDEINMQGYNAWIFYIHGMSDRHRTISKDPKMDLVIGYGAGSPASYTCHLWQKNFFMYKCLEAMLGAYEGKKGGPMSGWARSNMNQYFRKWDNCQDVFSMQIEIIRALRADREMTDITAHYLGDIIQDTVNCKSFSGGGNYRTY